MKELTLKEFQRRCLERTGDQLHTWTPSQWAIGVAEETGEICGAIKRINRIDNPSMGYYNNCSTEEIAKKRKELIYNIGEEIADAMTYMTILASVFDIDLEKAVIKKFNDVSAIKNSEVVL